MGSESSQSYDRDLRIALELAREAGAAILDLYEGPLDIEQKAGANDREPVTQADKLANEIIVQRLHLEFPADGILGLDYLLRTGSLIDLRHLELRLSDAL